MGTLCKKCPFKGTKKEDGHCTDLFVKKYHNSCVTYDITEDSIDFSPAITKEGAEKVFNYIENTSRINMNY